MLEWPFYYNSYLKQSCKDIFEKKLIVVMLAIHNTDSLALLCYSNGFMSMIQNLFMLNY